MSYHCFLIFLQYLGKNGVGSSIKALKFIMQHAIAIEGDHNRWNEKIREGPPSLYQKN